MAVKIVRQPNKIAIIGAPSSAAAFLPGSEKAPAALRAAGIVERLQSIGLNTQRLLHVEQEFEYAQQARPGDILTGVTTVRDGKARRGLDMATLETRYTNQRGELVVTAVMKVMVRE